MLIFIRSLIVVGLHPVCIFFDQKLPTWLSMSICWIFRCFIVGIFVENKILFAVFAIVAVLRPVTYKTTPVNKHCLRYRLLKIEHYVLLSDNSSSDNDCNLKIRRRRRLRFIFWFSVSFFTADDGAGRDRKFFFILLAIYSIDFEMMATITVVVVLGNATP